MSFSNFEFPNTNFYNSDLRELIAMYKELLANYSEIKSEIDEAIQKINEFSQYIDEEIAKIADAKLSALSSRVTMLETEMIEVDNRLDSVDVEIDDIVSTISVLMIRLDKYSSEFKADIAEVYNVFGEYKESIDKLIDYEIQRLVNYIDEHVTKIDRLYVVNPLTGKYEGIQEVLDSICENLLAGFGITAQEYDDLKLTAIQYDVRRIKAMEYSSRGYLIFYKELIAVMRSPFSGEVEKYDNIIEGLANLHKEYLTAQAYDDVELSAEVYDSYLITAYDYDWNGKKKVAQP